VKLYLVRHGEAVTGDVDPMRPLSERGRGQADSAARFVEPLGLAPQAVWHSTKARAEQTAEILRGALGGAPEMIRRPDLSPNSPPEPIAEQVAAAESDVMIVGHLPFMGRLASMLLTGETGQSVLGFRTASLACLERDDEGGWLLGWMVHPGVVSPSDA